MGTRGLVGIRINGEFKASYNHWDSNPDELGKDVVDFCKSVEDWDKFRENSINLILVNPNDKVPLKLIEKYIKFTNVEVGNQREQDWYHLLRECQGVNTLKFIYDGSLEHISDDYVFITDEASCQYAYIIDFDTNELWFYENGNNIVGSCPLDNIPDDWMEQFYPAEKE